MQASDNKTLNSRSRKAIWHPCSQMKDHEWLPLIPIKSGKGIFLEDYEGTQYIDAVSSWWVNILGHANPKINQAIKDQVDSLEHVILSGFTHQPAVELAEKLIDITPDPLSKVFYADNGSSGVEVALKMSFHYWKNTGKINKTKFITLSNSYHGETLGALSVGDVSLYKETYQPLLLETITAPSPDCFYREEGESWYDYSLRQFQKMETLLAKHAHETCAVIVEPLIQCAGYMRMYHPIYLTRLKEACERHQVHLIADEIAVGFGRTGTLFACEQAKITPDFLCLSKGLTGGYLPLCAVLTHDKIYDAFYDDYQTLRAFLHSHSYTGNPLACAAALATIKILEEEQVITRNQELIQHMTSVTQGFEQHPHVAEVRQTGMVLAIEMIKNKSTKEPYPWQERRGLKVYQHALKQGALLRPLGNVVYFMPPYIITKEQIQTLADIAWQGIELATKDA